MYSPRIIAEAVEECRFMWEDQKLNFALIRSDEGYMIYNKIEKGLDGTEIDEANEIICQKMIEAGVEIWDEYPKSIGCKAKFSYEDRRLRAFPISQREKIDLIRTLFSPVLQRITGELSNIHQIVQQNSNNEQYAEFNQSFDEIHQQIQRAEELLEELKQVVTTEER